ncbi:unnamed protein product, partial [Iphiclides podalirius]
MPDVEHGSIQSGKIFDSTFIAMAMFLKLSFLITCFVMVNCKPRKSYEKTVLHVKVNNDGIVKTVSSSQITTYSSFGSFGGFGVARSP